MIGIDSFMLGWKTIKEQTIKFSTITPTGVNMIVDLPQSNSSQVNEIMADAANEAQMAKISAFRRLAEGRTNRVLKALRILSNLGNRAHYTYSKPEVLAMFDAIEQAVAEARREFEEKETKQFKFQQSELNKENSNA